MATVRNPEIDVEVEECLIMKVEKDSEWASEPILERSGSTECESFRKCFRQFCYEDVTGPHEAFSKLWELCCRWLKPEMRSKEQILEQLVIEQFLTILPEKIQAWAQKQCPESGEEAVALVVLLEKETRRLRKQVSEDVVGKTGGQGCISGRAQYRNKRDFKKVHKPNVPKSRFEFHTKWRREFLLNFYLAN